MGSYYDYRDVKVMIAHELMKRDGWKVYGYKEDCSDSMTDYWDPADWDGIAEKNGYILVVNHSRPGEPQEIRSYNYTPSVAADVAKKIEKLRQMTVERGASEQEEASAKASIEKLLAKASASETESKKYTVTGMIPGHMANPSRCNWHLEKDGIIVAKGSGLLKYARVDSYFNYDSYKKDMMDFKRKSKESYIADYAAELQWRWNDDLERAIQSAKSHYEDMVEHEKLYDEFNQFIGKLDTTAGGLMGNADYEYKKTVVTEYKTEMKAVEAPGSIKEGQCFILKVNFNYGCCKGYVYRIHQSKVTAKDGKPLFTAVKLNGKLTKECHGSANKANHMFYCSYTEEIQKWVDKGHISFCEIRETKIPYEVEKVVKVPLSQDKSKPETVGEYTYNIQADTDTRDGSALWVVKVQEKLNREEYLKVNAKMKELGGYYSRFKKGFIFRFDPSEALAA